MKEEVLDFPSVINQNNIETVSKLTPKMKFMRNGMERIMGFPERGVTISIPFYLI